MSPAIEIEQEVQSDNGRSCQRVSNAALEDQVDIHQPVANDGPAEGERQNHQRDTGELVQDAGNRHSRQGTELYIRRVNGAIASMRAAGEPFELLAAKRVRS